MNISDPRVNFALNCGSLSNPPSVPIYHVDRLEEQLDLASVYYLQESVSVVTKSKGVQVTLPQNKCVWLELRKGKKGKNSRGKNPKCMCVKIILLVASSIIITLPTSPLFFTVSRLRPSS